MDLAQMEGIEACTLAQGPQTLRDRIDRICFKRGIPGIEPGTLQITKRILGSEVTGTQILPNSTGPFVINATNRIFFKRGIPGVRTQDPANRKKNSGE